jgi:hypothetical protein
MTNNINDTLGQFGINPVPGDAILTMLLPEEIVQEIEHIAYEIDNEPYKEIEALEALLELLPTVQAGEHGGPREDMFLLYALRHLIGSLLLNRKRASQ